MSYTPSTILTSQKIYKGIKEEREHKRLILTQKEIYSTEINKKENKLH